MLDDEKILARALTVTEAYDTFLKISDEHFTKNKGTLYDVKKQLLRAMVNVNALEALRFYVSFACSFAFGELKVMEGSAKIIGLIARDEALHLAITNNIIKNWQKGDDPEYVQIWEESKDEVYAIYDTVVREEKEWADYMMSKGSIIGLNTTLLHQYIEVTANKRLRNLGLQPVYDISSSANINAVSIEAETSIILDRFDDAFIAFKDSLSALHLSSFQEIQYIFIEYQNLLF